MKLISQFYDHNKYLIYSVCISITVIFWDCMFAIEHFEVNPYLAILMMIEVELSYIALPYMQEPEPILSAREKKKIRNKLPSFNQVMVVIFFLASMTPAALQISNLLIEKMVNKVTTEPTIPTEPKKVDVELDVRKEEWNKYQISVNDELNDQQKLALVRPIEKRLNDLKDQKSTYTNAITQFNKDVQAYPAKKEAYEQYKAKGDITFIFDYISLALGFIIMVSLQVMNGYLSKQGKKERDLQKHNITSFTIKTTKDKTVVSEIVNSTGEIIHSESGLQLGTVREYDLGELIEPNEKSFQAIVTEPNAPIQFEKIIPPLDLTLDSIKERSIKNQ